MPAGRRIRIDVAGAVMVATGMFLLVFGLSQGADGGWSDPLNDAALARRVPVLGICLGMQLLCRRSEEGVLPGLGWIAADVRRLQPRGDTTLKIPHIGWSPTRVARDNPLIAGEEPQRYYFVHSFAAVCDDPADVIATVDYGGERVAALGRDGIVGAQFHPEKSHRYGMALFRRWLELPA